MKKSEFSLINQVLFSFLMLTATVTYRLKMLNLPYSFSFGDKRVGKLLFIFLLSNMTGIGKTSSAEKQKDERMNVLFIVSDDLCVNAMEMAATPNLDRLASMGVNFTNAYAQYTVSCPSRNSFLSGMYPEKLGGGAWEPLRELKPNVTTLPQLFRENGFYTASIAKVFHVDSWDKRWGSSRWEYDDKKSWDFRINCPPANQGEKRQPPFPRKGIRIEWPGLGGPIDYGMKSFESDLAQEDGQATQEAIRQLDLPKEKPFFLAVGYRRPHAPFVAPEEYFWPYPLNSIQLPDPGDRSDVTKLAFSNFPPNNGEPEAMKKQKMCYLASVSFLDAQVGRLLNSLENQGLMENTIIIFFSDHGFQLGEHGNWNKNTIFEESAEVPLMIRIPGVTTAGQVSDEMVELVDLYPTLQEYFDLPEANQEIEGNTLMTLLKDPNAILSENNAAFTQVRRSRGEKRNAMGYSVRFKDFRYNEWWTVEGESELLATELYDLEKDPASEVNLNDDPEYDSVREKLSNMIDKYRSN
jgi:uncharacterized sulfatase